MLSFIEYEIQKYIVGSFAMLRLNYLELKCIYDSDESLKVLKFISDAHEVAMKS